MDDWEAEQAQRKAAGRRLIESGVLENTEHIPTNTEMALAIDYWRGQRQQVERRGKCSGGCREALIPNRRGELVCKHTHQPCPSAELGAIVELFSVLNGE